MGCQVIWSPEAVADLVEIRTYIARDSEAYAVAVVERILVAVDRLADFPRHGRRVPEIDDDSIRELIVDTYRVIYRVQTNSIDLAAIVHGSRDLPRFLQDRDV